MTYRVAVAQMNSQVDAEENIRQAERFIQQAADLGARLICLPENFASYGQKDFVAFAQTEAREKRLQGLLSNLSEQYNLHIVAGSIPLWDEQSAKCFNSSLLFSPNKACVTRYNKIHLFDVDTGAASGNFYQESQYYQAGSEVVCATIDAYRLGLSVCYDLRFPELYQQLRDLAADFITVPSAFTYHTGSKHWQILLQARAIETQCFVIASNQTGVHANQRRSWGHSMIISPDGEILAQAGGEPVLIYADCDMNQLQTIRRCMPIWQHKRLV